MAAGAGYDFGISNSASSGVGLGGTFAVSGGGGTKYGASGKASLGQLALLVVSIIATGFAVVYLLKGR